MERSNSLPVYVHRRNALGPAQNAQLLQQSQQNLAPTTFPSETSNSIPNLETPSISNSSSASSSLPSFHNINPYTSQKLDSNFSEDSLIAQLLSSTSSPSTSATTNTSSSMKSVSLTSLNTFDNKTSYDQHQHHQQQQQVNSSRTDSLNHQQTNQPFTYHTPPIITTTNIYSNYSNYSVDGPSTDRFLNHISEIATTTNQMRQSNLNGDILVESAAAGPSTRSPLESASYHQHHHHQQQQLFANSRPFRKISAPASSSSPTMTASFSPIKDSDCDTYLSSSPLAQPVSIPNDTFLKNKLESGKMNHSTDITMSQIRSPLTGDMLVGDAAGSSNRPILESSNYQQQLFANSRPFRKISAPASSSSPIMSASYSPIKDFNCDTYLSSSSSLGPPVSIPSESFVKSKLESEKMNYKEHRRVCHINAEQKRRCNIKNGFDTLRTLLPSLNQNSNIKISKAAMLQKAAEHIRQMKADHQQYREESNNLKRQIEALNYAIGVFHSELPATGAPVSCQRTSQIRERFDVYIRERTNQNWKFYVFGLIMEALLESYMTVVTTNDFDDMARSILRWMERSCSLTTLRREALSALINLSTTTNILSEPDKLSEEILDIVQKKALRVSD